MSRPSEHRTEARENVSESVDEQLLLETTDEKSNSDEIDPLLFDNASFITPRRGRRIGKSIDEKKNWYNTVELQEVARIADRYGISDRVTAAIATATLIDFGIISGDDRQFVVDRNKIRRHRNKLRNLQIQQLDHNDIQGLYFDGRKDSTKVYTDTTMKKVKEEHISFVQQPDSLFIGHKSVENSEADTSVAAIESLLNEKSIPKELIKAVGCDGTNVNTGEKGGIIRKLEIK